MVLTKESWENDPECFQCQYCWQPQMKKVVSFSYCFALTVVAAEDVPVASEMRTAASAQSSLCIQLDPV